MVFWSLNWALKYSNFPNFPLNSLALKQAKTIGNISKDNTHTIIVFFLPYSFKSGCLTIKFPILKALPTFPKTMEKGVLGEQWRELLEL